MNPAMLKALLPVPLCPQIYKSTKCNDMQQSGSCPRGPFCAFAHVERKLYPLPSPPAPEAESVSQQGPCPHWKFHAPALWNWPQTPGASKFLRQQGLGPSCTVTIPGR